jgi:hypothetical protein
MKTIVMTAAATALLLSSAASAQIPTTPTKVAPTAGESDKLVCKTEEKVGSRLGGARVCLTAEQWKEKAREHREFTEDIQSGTYARDSADQMRDSRMGGAPQ